MVNVCGTGEATVMSILMGEAVVTGNWRFTDGAAGVTEGKCPDSRDFNQFWLKIERVARFLIRFLGRGTHQVAEIE